MSAKKPRLLCLGEEIDSLLIRCQVLQVNGYDAHALTFREAERVLRSELFDLVIISVASTDAERAEVSRLTAHRVPTLHLYVPTFPDKLLEAVKQKLAEAVNDGARMDI